MSFATSHSVPLGQRINVEQKNKKNMKKTYMTPAVEVIRIETQGMIALSGLGKEYTSTDVSYSRGGDDWDDED